MKTKFLLLNEALTFNGAIVEAGDVIELSELSADALINEEKAVEVEPDKETRKALKGEMSPEGKEATGSDDKGDKYTRDKLAEEAKAVEVEFAYDAKKGEIIDAVAAAGKAEVLLAK
jgi:hypothetical protein